MDQEVPLGLMQHESTATVTYPDGSEETIEHKVKYSPESGYMPIEDFMRNHLKAYDVLLDVFVVLTELKFQQSKLKSVVIAEDSNVKTVAAGISRWSLRPIMP